MPTAEPSVSISLKKILVATDFSEGSQRALLTGLGIARRYGAQVQIVHAVPSEGYGVTGAGMLGAANFAWHTAHRLESALLQNGSLDGIYYQLRLEKGEVWPVLSRVVEQECIDLVVVATHGRTGVWKLLLGSVAEKVFRHAACPVLTVGPNVQPPSPDSTPPRSILFPTDFSRQSEHAFPYAASLALQHDAQLVLLHVIQPTGRELAPDNDMVRRSTNARLRKLVTASMDVPREPELVIETGSPAETILKVAGEHSAELIVLGVRSRTGLSDRMGWSTAYKVVREARCPVLTVRSGAQ